MWCLPSVRSGSSQSGEGRRGVAEPCSTNLKELWLFCALRSLMLTGREETEAGEGTLWLRGGGWCLWPWEEGGGGTTPRSTSESLPNTARQAPVPTNEIPTLPIAWLSSFWEHFTSYKFSWRLGKQTCGCQTPTICVLQNLLYFNLVGWLVRFIFQLFAALFSVNQLGDSLIHLEVLYLMFISRGLCCLICVRSLYRMKTVPKNMLLK